MCGCSKNRRSNIGKRSSNTSSLQSTSSSKNTSNGASNSTSIRKVSSAANPALRATGGGGVVKKTGILGSVGNASQSQRKRIDALRRDIIRNKFGK